MSFMARTKSTKSLNSALLHRTDNFLMNLDLNYFRQIFYFLFLALKSPSNDTFVSNISEKLEGNQKTTNLFKYIYYCNTIITTSI